MGGFSRLFSVRALSELVKSWLKILAIGAVGYLTIKQDMLPIPAATPSSAWKTLLPTVGWATIKAALTISGAGLVIGAADYGYQRFPMGRDVVGCRAMKSRKESCRGRRSGDQIEDSQHPTRNVPQAHDGGRAHGGRDHHQPDHTWRSH